MDRYYNLRYESNYHDKLRIIFHIDIDSFFVSCERILRPWLFEKPVVIAKHRLQSVITSASYEVRRLTKAVAGMPLEEVRGRVRSLHVIEPSHDFYEEKSQEFCNFLKANYSHFIERYSIDEVFLDVTNIWESWGHPKLLAKEIQERLLYELKLPATIGIGYSKFSAKMATNLSKPYGIRLVLPSTFRRLFGHLSLIEFFGIGPRGVEQLAEFGIKSIDDLSKRPYGDILLQTLLGKRVLGILEQAKGGGFDKVDIYQEQQREYGQLYTFLDGLSLSRVYVFNQLSTLIRQVLKRAKEGQVVGRVVVVLARFDKRRNWHSKQERLRQPTSDLNPILRKASKLLDRLWRSGGVYGIGFKLKDLVPLSRKDIQLSLFD